MSDLFQKDVPKFVYKGVVLHSGKYAFAFLQKYSIYIVYGKIDFLNVSPSLPQLLPHVP